MPKLPTFPGLGKKNNKETKIAGSPATSKNGDVKGKLIIKEHLEQVNTPQDDIDEITNNGDVHELVNNLEDTQKIDHKNKILDNESHSLQVSSV